MVSCNEKQIMNPSISVKYPVTDEDTISDNYHGRKVSDKYRWLEDDHAPKTKEWVEEQNKVTFDYLSKIPYRNKIKTRLEKLWNYEKFSSPLREGNKYYYFKNNGLQNQSVLYSTVDLINEGEVVLDPNLLSKDGTSALGGFDFSKDGKLMAYMINEAGSDWATIQIMDVGTKNILKDKLSWVKFSGISWKDDGFYYSRYPDSKTGSKLTNKNEFHSLYYHKIGTDQKDDKLIYVDNKHPQRNVYGMTTEDERYLAIAASESTSGNTLKIIDLKNKDGKPISIVEDFANDYNVVESDENYVYILTNSGAPKNKLIKVDIAKPTKENWQDVIPESNDPLSSITFAGGKIFANYMHNACSKIKVFDLNGKFIKDLELPGIGSSGGINGKKEDKEAFFSYTSFTQPNTIYTLNTESLESKIFKAPKLDFDVSQYKTKQEWFTSKDGTKIPIFITMKKGTKLNGDNPAMLYGYGGFDISITPSFSISKLPLLEQGGIYAVANIRGGGEFGKDWHKAGTLEKKQNVFDDFIAAAEYLISKKYTNNKKLAIQGGSNGGLLVGACMTQRPDLYAVAFPAVGVLDMLRYHNFTIGWAWATDYGRSDDPKMFPYLIKYSPLHNIKQTEYPATLITTADHDDRVVPAHSFKFAAELQKNQKGNKPALIRIETSAGHGAGKPTGKLIEESADILSFLFYNTNSNYSDNHHN